MTNATKAATHMPGPWHEHTVTIIQFENDANHSEECVEISSANGVTVAYIPIAAEGKTFADGKANARLIAAAPEMLAALEQLQNIAPEVRAVICKAKGEL